MNNSKIVRNLYISLLGVMACAVTPSFVYGSQQKGVIQLSPIELSSVVAENRNQNNDNGLSYVIDIGHDETSLAEEDFLPAECAISYFDTIEEKQAVTFLKYLGTFQGEAVKDRSPFTRKEQQIFDDVQNIEKRTAWWLTKGQAAILASALAPMIGFEALSTDISNEVSIASISGATTFAGEINAWLAFYATGTLPNSASIKANDRQYKFTELIKVHNRVTRTLIDLYFSDEKHKQETAVEIAHALRNSFEPLRKIIKEKVGYEHADYMLCPMKEATHYILEKKNLGISTSMHDYIKGKETDRTLKEITRKLGILS